MRTPLIALVVLLSPLVAQAAEPLERLFFTPEQRAQLDTLRTRKVVAVQTKDEPPPEIVTYSGIVRRSDGKTTVWVNNRALSEQDIQNTTSLVGRIERDGRILVQPVQGTTTSTLRLKVGQRAELITGQIDESYTSKRINESVKPPSRPAPQAPKDAQLEPPSMPSLEELKRTAPPDPAVQEKLKTMTDAVRDAPLR